MNRGTPDFCLPPEPGELRPKEQPQVGSITQYRYPARRVLKESPESQRGTSARASWPMPTPYRGSVCFLSLQPTQPSRGKL
jgi:hypothetical protein